MVIAWNRRAALVAGAWTVCVIGALAVTLNSLSHDSFDGLNNLYQIPFALPWFLIPIAGRDHVLDAWVTAAMGLVNAAVIYVWMSRRNSAISN